MSRHRIEGIGTMFVSRVRYHRNGVAGVGFYAVAFRVGRRKYLATVFPGRGEYAVLSADGNLCERWRGDMYEAALEAAIDIAHADGSAYKDCRKRNPRAKG